MQSMGVIFWYELPPLQITKQFILNGKIACDLDMYVYYRMTYSASTIIERTVYVIWITRREASSSLINIDSEFNFEVEAW